MCITHIAVSNCDKKTINRTKELRIRRRIIKGGIE